MYLNTKIEVYIEYFHGLFNFGTQLHWSEKVTQFNPYSIWSNSISLYTGDIGIGMYVCM